MHGLAGRTGAPAGEAPGRTAVLLIGHGSRAAEANEGMYRVIDRLREKWPERFVTAAFLEINTPSIPEGVGLCVAAGAERVIVHPYFLHLGNHVRQDLPAHIEESRRRHPSVEILLGPHLGYHEKLVGIVEERVAEALEGALVSQEALWA